MVIMNDFNALILCDLFANFRKIMQQTEKEALIWDDVICLPYIDIVMLYFSVPCHIPGVFISARADGQDCQPVQHHISTSHGTLC